jgi:hypothetical protein
MKKTVRQPLFWAGVAMLLLAVALAVCSTVLLNRTPAAVRSCADAINSRSVQKLEKCIAPGNSAEDPKALLDVIYSEYSDENVRMEPGEVVNNDANGRRAAMFMLTEKNGVVDSVTYTPVGLERSNGRDYVVLN